MNRDNALTHSLQFIVTQSCFLKYSLDHQMWINLQLNHRDQLFLENDWAFWKIHSHISGACKEVKRSEWLADSLNSACRAWAYTVHLPHLRFL